MCRGILSFVLVSLSIVALHAQPRHHRALVDSLLIKAQSAHARGDWKAVRQTYREILKKDEKNVPSLVGLGILSFQEEEWGDAADYLKEALIADPGNLETRYFLGRSFLETGKKRIWLDREVSLNRAREQFALILEKDSTFRDILFQIAELERYRDSVVACLEASHAYLRLESNDIESHVKVFRLYRYFIATGTRQSLLPLLKERGTEYDRFFTAELFRRSKDLVSAIPIYDALLRKGKSFPRQPVYLALARSYSYDGKAELVERMFWSAVSEIESHLHAALVLEDLKHIINDDELETFGACSTVEEKKDFFRSFWNKRNPFPAQETNLRLVEHYRRMTYAEEQYEYFGPRARYSDPDQMRELDRPKAFAFNEEFNDRGMVYLRHGQPDLVENTIQADDANESWMYGGTGEHPDPLIFHFMVHRFASPGDWRLSPLLPSFMLQDRVTMNPRYGFLAFARGLDRERIRQDLMDENRKQVSSGLTTERFAFKKETRHLEIPFTICTFRGKGEATLLELSYAVPAGEILRELPEMARSFRIEVGMALFDTTWRRIESTIETLQLPRPNNDSNLFIEVLRISVPPGNYHLNWHAVPIGTPLAGSWKFMQHIPRFAGDALAISDLQVAVKIESAPTPAKFSKHSLKVVPNPSRTIGIAQPLFLYFEIYNLALRTNGSTLYTIEYSFKPLEGPKTLITSIGSLFSSDKRIVIATQVEREGDQSFAAEHLAFNVNDLEPGLYELAVTIHDRVAGSTTHQSTRVRLSQE